MNTVPAFLRNSLKKQKHTKFGDAAEAYRPLLTSWLIEITLMFGWHKKKNLRRRHFDSIFDDSDFASMVELQTESGGEGNKTWLISETGEKTEFSDAACERLMKKRLATLSKKPLKDDMSLLSNIDMLGQILGMNEVEKAILCFATMLAEFSAFRDAIAGASQKVTTQTIARVIARISGYPESEVSHGLGEESILVSGGLLMVDKRACDFEDKFQLLEGLGGILLQEHKGEDALIGKFLRKAGKPSLSLQAYPHLAQDC